MPIPTLRIPLPGLRRFARAVALAWAVGLTLVGLEALARARLDRATFHGATRYYARPLVLEAGAPFGPERVEASLRRLGYARARGREVDPGEYRRGRYEWTIGRRAFRLGETLVPAGVTVVSLDYDGRVAGVADDAGRWLTRVLLEPETLYLGAGADGEDRLPVALADVPPHLVDAVLAVEDRRFFDHWGVDLRRIVGAAVANARAGRVVQGGSTLTQQLAKNLFLSARRTPGRKLRELAMALVLEARYTKEEILEAYLNEIYLGQNGGLAVHGVGRAAQVYFGKDVGGLEVQESALLAGMIRGPNLYAPTRHEDRARERRDLVLDLMRRQGTLDDRAHGRARRASLGVRRSAPPARIGRYFVDYVRETLGDRPATAVFTTLDLGLQLAGEAAVRAGLARLERDRPELRRGGSRLQGALVALDPRTGEILAMVGGRDYGTSQFNRAARARRQPGSAFKPVVALAALARRRHTLASLLADEPLTVETPAGPWTPVNYDRDYRGDVTLREALERSLNVPFARLGLEVGPERIVETARRLGIEGPLRPVPSLALGSAEVTPLELARAFGVLAAEGRLAGSHAILAIMESGSGKGERGDVSRFPYSVSRAFDPGEVFLVTSALEGAVERGTGRGLRSYGYRGPVAAKSGTTNEYRDAWFVAYTPSLVVLAWVGFDDGRSVGAPGARAALPIVGRVLAAAGNDAAERGFTPPPEVEVVEVDPGTGLRAPWGCPGEPEYFLRGTAPEGEGRCTPFWDLRRWLSAEVRPRMERELRPLLRELERRLEQWRR